MKVHKKAICLFLSVFIFINTVCAAVPVFAASAVGPSVGQIIPFGQLPAEQQSHFHAAVRRLVQDIFGISNEEKFVYIDPDTGEQFIGTEQEIYNYIYSHTDELGVSGVIDSDGNLTGFTIPSDSTFSSAEASLAYLISKNICEFSEYATYKAIDRNISYSVPSQVYQDSLKKTLNSIYGSKTPWQMGIEIANGKPQNVINIKEDLYISVFDTLGLQYTVAPSLLDFQYEHVTHKYDEDSNSSTYLVIPSLYYTPFFITPDNKLYLFRGEIRTRYSYGTYSGYTNYLEFRFANSNVAYTNFYTTTYAGSSNNGKFIFRFVENSGHLYFCCSNSYHNYSSTSYVNPDPVYYNQYTIGRPAVSNSPLLFPDYASGLNAPSSSRLETSFVNNLMKDGYDLSFVNATDSGDVITDSEILSADMIVAGYFQGSQSTIGFNSSTLNSAGQMLLGTENAVSGGDKTINSELSDWQKAIYVLAQQQGTTYEELLSKMDMIINSSGTVSVVGIDGIQYSVSELSKSFDEMIGAVGDISGDLSQFLEYIKSLNIEGISSALSSIDGTLGRLEEEYKDKAALGADIKSRLDILNQMVKDYTSSKSQVIAIENVQDIENIDSAFIIDKFPFSLPFDLYHIITLFVREPKEPIFTIPIETEINAFGLEQKIDEEIVLDLTIFKINGVDIVQAVLRFSMIVGFIIMLIKLTTKLFV